MRFRLSTLVHIDLEQTERGTMCIVEVYDPTSEKTRESYKDFFGNSEDEMSALKDFVQKALEKRWIPEVQHGWIPAKQEPEVQVESLDPAPVETTPNTELDTEL